MVDERPRLRRHLVRALGAGGVGALLVAIAWVAWAGVERALPAAHAPLPDQGAAGETWLPGFAIDLAQRTVAQLPTLVAGDAYRASSADADLELRRVGDEEWELRVHAKRMVRAVTFPWRTRASALDVGATGTVLLYPTMLGVAAQAPSAKGLRLDWRTYPGECFAPVLVLSDAHDAELVAASNWPPLSVVPIYAPEGLGMRYPSAIPAGTTRTFRALIAHRRGDEASGRAPWLQASLLYRTWLEPNLTSAGLRDVQAPQWLAESDGWQNVQLQNLSRFDAAALEARWQRWKGLLPWLQMWGQMSDYAGRRDLATVTGQDEVGCCIDRIATHERYGDGLDAAIAQAASGGQVGLYARPRSPYHPLEGGAGAAAERAFLLGWLAHNQALGANAFYVDVLGHRFFGEPLDVARFVRDQLPPATVIEYAVDVYPRPALVSGSLTGGSFGGGPAREPHELGQLAVARTTFPRFGRALLPDAILFLGESNGDHVFWGGENDHWGERQAFLLGAKLDAMHVAAALDRPDQPNEALLRIIEARRAAGWWRRRPVYLDRLGVSAVPDGVDVRRFRGRDGEDLVVADNWSRRAGVSIRLDGRPVAISAEPLSIHVVEAGA